MHVGSEIIIAECEVSDLEAPLDRTYRLPFKCPLGYRLYEGLCIVLDFAFTLPIPQTA